MPSICQTTRHARSSATAYPRTWPDPCIQFAQTCFPFHTACLSLHTVRAHAGEHHITPSPHRLQGNARYMKKSHFCFRKRNGRRDQYRPPTAEQRCQLRLVTTPASTSGAPTRTPPSTSLATSRRPVVTAATTTTPRSSTERRFIREHLFLAWKRYHLARSNGRAGSSTSEARNSVLVGVLLLLPAVFATKAGY